MFSRIASKVAFSRFQLRNPKLFCSQAANDKNSSSVSQFPHNLGKRTDVSIGGGLSVPWMAFSAFFAIAMVYEVFSYKDVNKKREMRVMEMERMKKEMQGMNKELERVNKLL